MAGGGGGEKGERGEEPGDHVTVVVVCSLFFPVAVNGATGNRPLVPARMTG